MYSFKRFYEKLIKIQIGKRARLFYRKISIAQINFSIMWSWISSLIDMSGEIETAALPHMQEITLTLKLFLIYQKSGSKITGVFPTTSLRLTTKISRLDFFIEL